MQSKIHVCQAISQQPLTCLESFLLELDDLPVLEEGRPGPGLPGRSVRGGIFGNVGVLLLLDIPFVTGLAFILVLIGAAAPFRKPLEFLPADRGSP